MNSKTETTIAEGRRALALVSVEYNELREVLETIVNCSTIAEVCLCGMHKSKPHRTQCPMEIGRTTLKRLEEGMDQSTKEWAKEWSRKEFDAIETERDLLRTTVAELVAAMAQLLNEIDSGMSPSWGLQAAERALHRAKREVLRVDTPDK